MGDESRNTGTSDSSTDKQILRDFIAEYKQLPELWDVRSKEYTKRDKKNAVYEKLLTIYKGLKSDATVDEVKKKINTLRSNFRKELKKINDSKRSGAGSDDIYVPSSWVFEELTFLTNLEKPVESISSMNEETVKDSETIDDLSVSVESNASFVQPQSKKPKSSIKSVTQQNELLSLACGYLSKQDTKEDSDLHLAKVWTNKLKCLDPNQRLYAEKAINDILFEAQLGTLHRNSIQINESSLSSQPSTCYSRSSTPLSSSYNHISTPLISHSWIEPPMSISDQNVQPNTIQSYISAFNNEI